MPGGETGLVHISEVANSYVKDIHDHLKKSDLVKVKVLSVDGSGKIGLSIRQALAGSSARGARGSRSSRSCLLYTSRCV